MSETDRPTVLVVEDEPDVAETYELWLAGDYDVRLVDSGADALEALEEAVDVVLLDRMMPGLSGDEVLAEIRRQGHDVQVVMVTAVDPDFDVVEMGFDAYLTKPPTRERIHETIEDLLERAAHTETVRAYRSLLARRAALEDGKTAEALAESDEYADLEARIADLEADLDTREDLLLDDSAFVGAIREYEGDADGQGGGGT